MCTLTSDRKFFSLEKQFLFNQKNLANKRKTKQNKYFSLTSVYRKLHGNNTNIVLLNQQQGTLKSLFMIIIKLCTTIFFLSDSKFKGTIFFSKNKRKYRADERKFMNCQPGWMYLRVKETFSVMFVCLPPWKSIILSLETAMLDLSMLKIKISPLPVGYIISSF